MEERLGPVLNWLKLHFLVDYVTPELRKLFLEKLKKMLGKEWDGSPESVKSLKDNMGENDYSIASFPVQKKIDKGDIENWDLTAVSHVLRSLKNEQFSVEEKERMEAVTTELRKLILEILKKMLGHEWDGSSVSVKSLTNNIGKGYRSASGPVRKQIDKGDIENWDLTAVAHVLCSLKKELFSVEEKERMEVTPELRKLLLEKLKKTLGKEWDGSPGSVKSLTNNIGKGYRSASGPVRKQIDKGDIENWDLTAVAHVLRSLKTELFSVEEKKRMEAAVEIRNYLSHHPSKVIPQEEFDENQQKLIDLLSSLNVRTDEIEEKIKFRISDLSSLSSQRVSNAEASKIMEGGSAAFRIADYAKAIEKFDDALKVASLKEAEQGVLFCYRSAAFIQMAKEERFHERKDFAKRAKKDAVEAARLQPVWIEVYSHLGDAYKLLEKYEKAIKAYDEALSLDPCLEIVQARRDDCRHELGQSRKRERIMNAQQYIKNMDTLDTHPLSIDLMIEQRTQNQTQKFSEELHEEFIGYWKSANALVDELEGTWYRYEINVVVDYGLATNYFSRSANEGKARGIYVLARLTKKGLGVKKDYRRAFQLFNQAAEMPPILPNGRVNEGVLAAMHCIAMMYFEGVGVELCHYNAFCWYKRAADLGFGPSAYNLAVMMYTVGRGVPESHPVKAMQYWKLAAQLNNARAMLALAVHYLTTLDVGQARKWFEFAVEAKEIQATSTQQVFEAACKAKEEKTIWDIADVEEWEKEINLPSSNLSGEDRMERFLYFNIHWRRIAVSPTVHYNFFNKDYNYKVTEEYVSQGRVYAQQVLKAIGHYKLALSGLYSYEKSPNDTVGDSIITQTALCIQTADYVFCFEAEGHRTSLAEIVKKKLSEMEDQICEMDCYVRICYAKLQMDSCEENVKFLEKCIDRYPKVPFLYAALVSTHNNLGLYHEGIKQAQKGLDWFPENFQLLFFKALSTYKAFFFENHEERKEERVDMKQVIDCYKVFLKHAPADHRFVPEVYYSMARVTLQESLKKNIRPIDKAVRTYYEKGLESEKQLLPCFLPYEELSDTKSLISAYFIMTAKDVEEKMSFSLKSVYSPMSKLDRLTDPVRVQTIRNYREFRFLSRALDPTKATAVPPRYVQCAPSCASNDLKSITISEMNPLVDKVYEDHVIDVTIIDDPSRHYSFCVVCVVEDTRGDVLPGFFYNVEGDRRIKFGAKVSIRQPYLNIGTCDQKPGIRVDDPKSLIFHEADSSERPCQSCGERNAPLTCPDCKKAAYCSEDCQTHDREVLGHVFICNQSCRSLLLERARSLARFIHTHNNPDTLQRTVALLVLISSIFILFFITI